MRIAVTGSTGFVGKAVTGQMMEAGHTVIPVIRPQSRSLYRGEAIRWDPSHRHIEAQKLESIDAVIHLAGASIAAHRWTPAYKQIILKSRIEGTEFLSRTIAGLKTKPRLFLSASAVGFYGSCSTRQMIDEKIPAGKGFLSEVCVAWGKATQPMVEAGVRVVPMRFGMVLGKEGALAKMLPIFKLGLGGPLGTGEQVISWVAVDEIPKMMLHVIAQEELTGPVNFVSPFPITNAGFTKFLAKVLKRPAVFPVPALAVQILFGEMGRELLLSGATVLPAKLADSDYRFVYSDLESALRSILKK